MSDELASHVIYFNQEKTTDELAQNIYIPSEILIDGNFPSSRPITYETSESVEEELIVVTSSTDKPSD